MVTKQYFCIFLLYSYFLHTNWLVGLRLSLKNVSLDVFYTEQNRNTKMSLACAKQLRINLGKEIMNRITWHNHCVISVHTFWCYHVDLIEVSRHFRRQEIRCIFAAILIFISQRLVQTSLPRQRFLSFFFCVLRCLGRTDGRQQIRIYANSRAEPSSRQACQASRVVANEDADCISASQSLGGRISDTAPRLFLISLVLSTRLGTFSAANKPPNEFLRVDLEQLTTSEHWCKTRRVKLQNGM